MGIKLQGLSALTKKLKKLEDAVSTELDAELRAGAITIASTARTIAPRHEGRLGNSVTPNTSEYLFKTVTTNVFYAPYMEFGTGKKVRIPPGLEQIAARAKGKKRQIKKGGIDPRPFFYKAGEIEGPKIVAKIARIIKNATK